MTQAMEMGNRPCPVCGRQKRCKEKPDGNIHCFRKNVPASGGYVRIKQCGECTIYRRGGVDLNPALKSLLQRTALGLGVSIDSLKLLDMRDNNGCPSFPERNAAGEITAFNTRHANGDKRVGRGEKRGLIIPSGLSTMPDPVLVVEGASDVAASLTMGLTAVGRPMAKCASVVSELAKLLDGRDVVVVGENDRKDDGSWPGKDGAIYTAGNLKQEMDWNALEADTPERGKSVRWVLPPKGVKDVRAYLQSRVGDDPEQVGRDLLKHLEDDAVEEIPGKAGAGAITVRLGDVQATQVEWLWPNRIPLGKLTLIAGLPGVGKSLVTVDVAARITRGRPLPDCGSLAHPPGDVILLTAEDDLEDTWLPRLQAAGGDPDRVCAIQAVDDENDKGPFRRAFDLSQDLERLTHELAKCLNPRLLIIDTVSSYLARTDSHKEGEVRSALLPLCQWAAQHKVAVLGVAHLTKDAKMNALHRIAGSIAFAGIARAAWLVVRDPTPDSDKKLFLRLKSNLAKDPEGLSYVINSDSRNLPVLEWGSEAVAMSADEALAGPSINAPRLQEAVEFLKEQLAGGQVLQTELKERLPEHISWAAVRRAKEELGVESGREGFGKGSKCYWSLPSSIEAQESLTPKICAPMYNNKHLCDIIEPAAPVCDDDPVSPPLHRCASNPIDAHDLGVKESCAGMERTTGAHLDRPPLRRPSRESVRRNIKKSLRDDREHTTVGV